MQYRRYLSALLLLPLSVMCLLAQDTSVREEMQRYIGYEPGTFKYLTLPYDLVMGSNVAGNYIDIGFLLLAMIGLIFLSRIPQKKWHYALVVLGALLYLSMSMHYGRVSLDENLYLSVNQAGFSDAIASMQQSWIDKIVISTYQANELVMGPVWSFISNVFFAVSSKDWVTIPALCIILLGIFLYSNWYLSERKKARAFQLTLAVLACVSFYWFLLSAGVLWYGFIIFILAFLLLIGSYSREYKRAGWIYYIFLAVLLGWGFLGLIYKTSNIYYKSDQPNFIVDPSVWMYYSGAADEDFVHNSYNRNVSAALTELNAHPEAKIYKVGTSFNYLIDKNNERVYEDNLLSFFAQIQKNFRDEEIASVLEASGYKYILIGLKMWSVDSTPEKTLQAKFKDFIGFVESADKLELVATDRRIRMPDGKVQYGMRGGELVDYGYYALYRIR